MLYLKLNHIIRQNGNCTKTRPTTGLRKVKLQYCMQYKLNRTTDVLLANRSSQIDQWKIEDVVKILRGLVWGWNGERNEFFSCIEQLMYLQCLVTLSVRRCQHKSNIPLPQNIFKKNFKTSKHHSMQLKLFSTLLLTNTHIRDRCKNIDS